ncbi:MAG TPA: TonB-dependent receptor [Flavobacteriales bacterium]|nr:TonB-dependent receptor [Flavobacteriales bacterium]
MAKSINSFFLFLLLLPSFSAVFAQGSLSGTVKNGGTGETLIGASVLYAQGKGIITDLDGNFIFKELPDGDYTITISYVGFKTVTQKVKIAGKPVSILVKLESTDMKEVEIIADVARSRETPIAFSNLSAQKIQEEIASRDLPMLLNSTPGVYATEQGGGMGDSRINIRGFDQRNVAVMVDGVPVNDMENGQVYWSNWDGLADITRSMQVQRGLGASKLAIQSVGGTINIITKGIEAKKNIFVKQEVGNNTMIKTSAGFNTGRLKGGWGITGAGSYKKGDGWTDQTYFEAWSYFIKIQKQFGKHLISLSANGAPQVHGQRQSRVPVAIYSRELAEKLGVNVDSILNNTPNSSASTAAFSNYTTAYQGPRGPRFNPGWGTYYDQDSVNQSINPNTNYYHKPQFNLSHFYTINSKLSLSTVAYVSIGRGGGTAFNSYSNFTRDSTTGQYNFSQAYKNNTTVIDPIYSTTDTKSNQFIRASVNNHMWYGAMSTLDYHNDKGFSLLGGIDLRSYRGSHYQEVNDLFGGDYVVSASNQLAPKPLAPGDPNFASRMQRVGDKVNYNNDGFVRWAGSFLQAEWKKGFFSFFVNGSFSYTGFKREDYFRKKDLIIGDSTFSEVVGWGDTLNYINDGGVIKAEVLSPNETATFNGTRYTMDSKEARYNTNDFKWFPGYTLKTGLNYNVNEFNNVFVNAGILSIAPRYALFYTNTSNISFPDAKQQFIYAAELGYGYKRKKFAANVNGYYTYWENKPPQSFANITYQGDQYSYQLQGLNTVHTGVEVDFTGILIKNLEYEGLASIGDWQYKKGGSAYLFDNNGTLTDTLQIQANGVHVGDAAQIQFAGGLRYEPFKGFYVKTRFTYFDKNFANLDPMTLLPVLDGTGAVVKDNSNHESWRMPSYYFIDFYTGYNFKFAKMNFTLNASIINILDRIYITDGINGVNFDAASSSAYISQGRRFNLGLKVSF